MRDVRKANESEIATGESDALEIPQKQYHGRTRNGRKTEHDQKVEETALRDEISRDNFEVHDRISPLDKVKKTAGQIHRLFVKDMIEKHKKTAEGEEFKERLREMNMGKDKDKTAQDIVAQLHGDWGGSLVWDTNSEMYAGICIHKIIDSNVVNEANLCYIHELFVRKEYRDNSLSSLLFLRLFQQCYQSNVGCIYLYVRQKDVVIGYYKHLGFVPIDDYRDKRFKKIIAWIKAVDTDNDHDDWPEFIYNSGDMIMVMPLPNYNFLIKAFEKATKPRGGGVVVVVAPQAATKRTTRRTTSQFVGLEMYDDHQLSAGFKSYSVGSVSLNREPGSGLPSEPLH